MVLIVFITHLYLSKKRKCLLHICVDTHKCVITLKFVNLTHDFEIENVSESHDFSVI